VELVLAAEDETAPAAAGAAADTPDDGGGGKGGLVREEDEGGGRGKKDRISEDARFILVSLSQCITCITNHQTNRKRATKTHQLIVFLWIRLVEAFEDHHHKIKNILPAAVLFPFDRGY